MAQIVLVLIPLMSLRERRQRSRVAVMMKMPEQSKRAIRSLLQFVSLEKAHRERERTGAGGS